MKDYEGFNKEMSRCNMISIIGVIIGTIIGIAYYIMMHEYSTFIRIVWIAVANIVFFGPGVYCETRKWEIKRKYDIW